MNRVILCAEDSFIGANIYWLLDINASLTSIEEGITEGIITFSHRVASYVIVRYGAIPSMPSQQDLD